ncbi:MAG: ATP-binding protein [Chloroflexota bacterium]|nr:ATP-binding protein [Chloroflexota bacterium]
MTNMTTLCVPGRTLSASSVIGLDAECARWGGDLSRHDRHTLETLGLLAGGVAHDFGNLLSALLGNAQLAQRLLEDPNAEQLAMISDTLRAIEQTVGTGKALVQHLFAITGRGDHTRQPVVLAALCQQLRSLLRASHAATIQFVEEFAPEVPAVIGDRVQLTQLVLNVLTNATEAIGGRLGTIRMTTTVGQCDRSHLDATLFGAMLPEGPYVTLTISDSGCGMDQATLARMFDPFFTTKVSGYGMGLPTIMQVVRNHQGTLEVTSAPGSGTTVTIWFPVAAAGG